jgi:nickel/cobalt transporter (NiCoT) family protein
MISLDRRATEFPACRWRNNEAEGAMWQRMVWRAFDDRSRDLRFKVIGIFALLIAVNFATWLWALAAFRDYPLLLGTALLAYGFGLRHAVDADHIAAIDNVTRKLMQEGKRPITVGLFFSLGHSSIVVLASIAIAATALTFKSRIEHLQNLGGMLGTLVSATFLIIIAAINVIIFIDVYHTFQKTKNGKQYTEDDLNVLLANRGFLARIFRPLFRLINHSWQMYPVGFLFGLGFDTATEIGLLGISAAEASKGLAIWSILVFPALFTAGMSLVDTTDGVLMLGAYGWAFRRPVRKLYYNMAITFVSVVVAVVVGGIEALGLIGGEFSLSGRFWGAMDDLNDNFGVLGFCVIGVFAVSWVGSMIYYRAKGYDRLEAQPVQPDISPS